MDKVKFGIIGVGNMGTSHFVNFNSGKIENGVTIKSISSHDAHSH